MKRGEIVSLDVACELHKKGFDSTCDYYYDKKNRLQDIDELMYGGDKKIKYEAPYINDAVDWIRSKGIHISANINPFVKENVWMYELIDIFNGNVVFKSKENEVMLNYEEARVRGVEKALYYIK